MKAVEVLGDEGVERGGIFVEDGEGLGVHAGFEGVLAGGGFAGAGAGSGGALRVAAICFDLFLGGHAGSLSVLAIARRQAGRDRGGL